MSQTPSISVVIPVHNGERFLADALRSVLAQSLPAAEIIVVDDGSTDRSVAVARQFAAPVRLVQQPHAGAGAARNAGIHAASGEFLALLDADDLMTAGRLAAQWKFLHSNAADLVFGQQYRFYDGEDASAALRFGALPAGRVEPALCGGALFCRRSAFAHVGAFEEQWKVGEVISWIARAWELGLVTGVPVEVVLCRRLHTNNTMLRSGKEHLASVVKAIRDRRRASSP